MDAPVVDGVELFKAWGIRPVRSDGVRSVTWEMSEKRARSIVDEMAPESYRVVWRWSSEAVDA